MSDDEPNLTTREERVAAALRVTLREVSEDSPLNVDVSAWVARNSRRRTSVLRLPLGMAAALVVMLVGAIAFVSLPRATGPGSTAPSLPGARGHFDNGSFSFDYPATWAALAGEYNEGLALQVFAVVGTGDWKTGCYTTANGGGCTGDVVNASGGRIVVKVYERVGGPVNMCGGDTTASATLGPNAVSKSTDGPTTTWEIRMPGADFGWTNNVFVEVWAGDPSQLAQAEALVGSFRWAANTTNAGNCYSAAQSGRYDDGNYSFDYPTDWLLISGRSIATPDETDVVLGTGTWASGCGGGGCTPVVDVSGGKSVVRVWRRIDGPPDGCMGYNQATATFGPNAVSESTDGSAVEWQIRLPGAEFGWMGNVNVEVWAGGASGRTQAEALVASFRWADSSTAGGVVCPTPTPTT
jgi:hypothetical protein